MSVIAAVVTVAGGLFLVWWQTASSGRETKAMLDRFSRTVRESDQLRAAVLRPLEGQWVYTMDWEVYFDIEEQAGTREGEFIGEGLASFNWEHDQYRILLGYRNRTRAQKVLAVSVNTGTLVGDSVGIVGAGAKMRMSYLYRKGVEGEDVAGQSLSTDAITEQAYEFGIESVKYDPSGSAEEIVASYVLDHSRGKCTFRRLK